MQEAFLAFINQFGYVAVAALILLENVFPPIPSEVILPMAGFLVLDSSMSLPGVIIAATAGSTLGAFILYGIGRLISRERLATLFDTRLMRVLGFKGSDVERAIGWFDTRGQVTVLICRCVPVVRSLISVPAGTAEMGLAKFALLTAVGSAVWNTVLCSLGYAAGNAWQSVSDQASWVIDVATRLVLLACVVAVVWWVATRVVPNLRGGAGRGGARG